jgi:hypothetical protein
METCNLNRSIDVDPGTPFWCPLIVYLAADPANESTATAESRRAFFERIAPASKPTGEVRACGTERALRRQ